MSGTSFLKYCRLAYLSGPSCERTIYRQMAQRKPKSILEIGLGLGVRTLRMFEVARRYSRLENLQYTGIDLFEARDKSLASMSLKNAYKLLSQQGAQVKLVPGDALAAMTLTANSALNTDLIVIDSDIQNSDLKDAWNYFPRMMHDQTVVLRQLADEQGKYIKKLSLQQIRELSIAKQPASDDTPKSRAAA